MKTRRKKRKASPAQLRALAKGRAALKAKSKSSSRRVKRARRKASLLASEGRHRPVVKVVRGRLVRPKRSSIPARASFVNPNPFLGELAMIGNPRRKRKHARRSYRRSHRRSSSRLFHNPGGKALAAVFAGPKEMASMEFVKDAASVAAGFVLPNMIVAKLPAQFRDSRPKLYVSKVVVIAGVSAAASVVSKRAAKMILLGGGVSLLLDLWMDFAAPMIAGAGAGAAHAPAPGTGVYYGPEVGVYYGGEGAASVAESFA